MCQQQRLENDRLRRLRLYSNLGHMVRFTFESIEEERVDPDNADLFRIALDAALTYAQTPSGWLIFDGPPGSGKTHLAASIANSLITSGTSGSLRLGVGLAGRAALRLCSRQPDAIQRNIPARRRSRSARSRCARKPQHDSLGAGETPPAHQPQVQCNASHSRHAQLSSGRPRPASASETQGRSRFESRFDGNEGCGPRRLRHRLTASIGARANAVRYLRAITALLMNRMS